MLKPYSRQNPRKNPLFSKIRIIPDPLQTTYKASSKCLKCFGKLAHKIYTVCIAKIIVIRKILSRELQSEPTFHSTPKSEIMHEKLFNIDEKLNFLSNYLKISNRFCGKTRNPFQSFTISKNILKNEF